MWSWLKNLFKKKEAPSRATLKPAEDWQVPPVKAVEYETMFLAAKPNPAMVEQTRKVVDKILLNRNKFVTSTTVPWYWLGAIMFQENSLDFSKQLLNGQKWDKRTTIVPKGLGPWYSFNYSLVFAINYKKLDTLKWDIGNALMHAEKWNGLGYRKRNIRSPYIWAGTDLQQKGLYVSDGKFDPEGWKTRPGVAAIFLELKARGEI